jgi:hypothetical protein
MTFDEMLKKVLEIFPNAVAEEDESGELVISTRTYLEDDKVTPLQECSDCAELTTDQWGGLCHDCDNQFEEE